MREVRQRHAAPVATVRVVVGRHDGVAEPRQGAQAAPVLPLVPVDGCGGVTTLDGDSAPRLPRHQPRALQRVGSCRQREQSLRRGSVMSNPAPHSAGLGGQVRKRLLKSEARRINIETSELSPRVRSRLKIWHEATSKAPSER